MKTKEGRVGEGVSSKIDGNIWEIWDIPLFSRRKSEVLSLMKGWFDSGARHKWVATVNPEFVMAALKDNNFLEILQKKTSLNVVDGIGLVWAKRLLGEDSLIKRIGLSIKTGAEILQGKHRGEITAGSDLMVDMWKLAAKNNLKIFLLGGWGNRAKKTIDNLNGKWRVDKVLWSQGEPKVSNEEVVRQINKFAPDILLVAYGMKRQEEWIAKNLKKIDAGVIMGVGRCFDYYSGELKRAPGAVRKIGLEWLYSLIQEPKRWKRQLVLPKFVWRVLLMSNK